MNVVEAYGLAWQEAKRRGDFDDAILLSRLDEVTERPEEDENEDEFSEGEETNWEHLQRLVLGLWHRKVPPRKFKKQLRRAVWREMLGFLRELWRLIRSGMTPRWMKPPRGKFVWGIFEPDEGDNFYDEADPLPWPVDLDRDWNEELLSRAIAARPIDDDELPCHDIPVWLAASDSSPQLDVMVGKERLVGANSDVVWKFLRKIAAEYHGIEGELSVWDVADRSRHELEVEMPPKELPEDYVSSYFHDE